MGRRVVFRIGDVFDPDDVVAQWVTTLGFAWNDLELANRRLIHGLQNDGRSSDNFAT